MRRPTIGFTGPRSGMTQAQKETFAQLLEEWFPNVPFLFHHGDCIGADAQAHQIIRHTRPNAKIITHPGCDRHGNEPTRAFCKADTILPAKPYLKRDREIVDVSAVLVATPKTRDYIGGTWYTIEYAQKLQRPLVLIWSNGTTQQTRLDRW